MSREASGTRSGRSGLPRVLAIVVSGDAQGDAGSSLRALYAACDGVAEIKALVVGAARDGEGTAFAEFADWARPLAAPEARSFVDRLNHGLVAARGEGELGDYLFLLAAGLRPDGGAVAEALRIFPTDAAIGAVAGAIAAMDGAPLPSAFRFPSLDVKANPVCPLGFIEAKDERSLTGQASVEVDFVPALSCMVRRHVVESIGGFDAALSHPYHAADFFLRMRAAGFSCRFTARSWTTGPLPSFCTDERQALAGRRAYLNKNFGRARAIAADVGWMASRVASLLTAQPGSEFLSLRKFVHGSSLRSAPHSGPPAVLPPPLRGAVETGTATGSRVGLVAIGRNEGERLRRCLESAREQVQHLVYVDSGSTDGSVAMAKAMGAKVVELDMKARFTAARARNAGATRLLELDPDIDFIHFVDGDCELSPGWVGRALDFALAHPSAAAVAGRRRERHPEASVYNRLCDREWNTPVGRADAVGGDALVRVAAFREVGGYDPTLIAGEEPEMCARLRLRGWEIWRIEGDMTIHDAAIFRVKQWWQRTRRSGHAYAEVSHRYRLGPLRVWARESRSICFWGAPFAFPAWPLLWWRLYRRDRDMAYALSTTVGKLPQLLGLLEFHYNRLSGKQRALIEYK